MKVITTGKKYIDIDGYASCLAYRELLSLRGIESKVVSSASTNYSVTNSLLNLPYKFDDYEIQEGDEFIIIDVSNRDFFEDFIEEKRIVEIIDHHPGFEDYWRSVLKSKAIMESIGSVATVIVEKYRQYNLLDQMSGDIAKLLMAAILDNTLNFTADITNKRDFDAYDVLEKISGIDNFQDEYFWECQKFIEENLETSIENDLKIEKVNDYLPEVLGQLTVWDISLLMKMKNDIASILSSYGDDWLINIISLKDDKSYIFCSNDLVQDNLKKLFDGVIENEFFITFKARLRKEIIKTAFLK